MRPRRILPALAVSALALVAAGCGSDDESKENEGVATQPPAQAEQRPSEGCRRVSQPAPEQDGDERRPRGGLSASRTYELVVITNCGDFTIRLDPDSAPEATASLVRLARNDFYDGTVFHRIVPGFVIQGGDPTGTGTGGPGYTTRDKPAREARYTKGVVAMAKAGDEPAGSGGSQFFVVTGDDAGLPPDYAIVGEVKGGLEVVERIGKLGDPSTEQPTEPVVVDDVEVRTE